MRRLALVSVNPGWLIVLGTTGLGFGAPQANTRLPDANDLGSLVTIDARGNATRTWIQDEGEHEQVIQALALTPGAIPIQIARSQPGP